MTAAGKLFGTTGLSEVTVAQILDHSGVKAPTLYHHFGGKEGLYVAWACQAFDAMEAEFKALSAKGLPLHDFLLESCRILLSPRAMDILQVMRDRRWLADPDSVEQVNDSLNEAVIRQIARAIQAGTTVKEPRDASQLFVHMVSTRLPQYRRSDTVEGIPPEAIVDVYLRGIQAMSPVSETVAELSEDQVAVRAEEVK
ncbi:MAG: TetR/AcrR family transcriptional regulator [Armatimonadetes bacterium]|nr:TetR/AcrR family transcriptional regulator [Armatimonadota bacterium]